MRRRIARTRLIAALAALLCALVSLTAVADTASAAPYVDAPAIAFNQTNPCAAATITVSGQNFYPDSTVDVRIGSRDLGTTKVDDDGNFTQSITLPSGLSGKQTVTADGGITEDGGHTKNSATSDIVINNACALGASVGPAGPTGSSSAGSGTHFGSKGAASGGVGGIGEAANDGNSAASSGLSNTGVAIFSMLVIALVLLGAGLALIFGGRRRKSATA